MDISEAVKLKYKRQSITKNIQVQFPDLGVTVDDKNIYYESMKLSEQISDSESIEFVGCIASKFQITIRDFGQDIKGQKIIAYIYTDDSVSEKIPLFHGIVDEAKLQSNHKLKDIVAYDELYTKGNIEVADWYKRLSFPISLGALRRSLFSYIGLQYTDAALPNDSVMIAKQYDPETLRSLDVIKSVCQINGVFGIIDRTGKFKFLMLPNIISGGSYPSDTLYPPFYPAVGPNEDAPEETPHYRSLEYQEYSVKPVDKIQIRQNEDDPGVTAGNGPNKYIIQGNMFTYKLTPDILKQVATNILPNVQGVAYIPYSVSQNGYPWIECGDAVMSYYVYDFDASEAQGTDIYKEMQFYVFSRNMNGIQNLKDEYNAKGNEYQREFITDLRTQVNTLKQTIKDDIIDDIIDDPELIEPAIEPILEDWTYPKEELDPIFENIDDRLTELEEGGTGEVRVISTDSIPGNPLAGVIYLIQCEVVVVN